MMAGIGGIIAPVKSERSGEKKATFRKTKCKAKYNHLSSEDALRAICPWHWDMGDAYHVLSQGDIDSLSFLRVALSQRPLDYCLLSTWCMAPSDAEEIKSWIDRRMIKRIDFYVGEIFQNGYRGAYDILVDTAKSCDGRVGIFRNHSKVMAGAAGDWSFVIESSANVNTNPRCENTVITMDRGLFAEYKGFFDKINPFNQEFDGWKPYILEEANS